MTRNIAILYIICFFQFSLSSQSEELYIEVRSDTKPEEISWTLSDHNGNIVFTDNGVITEANRVYNISLLVSKNDCFRFDIFDSGGDGIQSPGYYRIRRGDIWIQGIFLNFKENNFHYSGNCEVGKRCNDPMLVTSPTMYGLPIDNFWYNLNIEEDAYYAITACSNYDTSSHQPLDTKFWIYDGCPSQLSDGPQGALAYNDDYSGCLPGAGLFNYFIQAHRDYIIRVSFLGIAEDDLIEVNFERLPDLMGCTDPASCNYNPFAKIDDGSCSYNNCLPDLAIGKEEFANSIFLDKITVEDHCLVEEFCVRGFGTRDIIRFSTVIYNEGTADYIVGNPEDNDIGFSINNCHEHWHRLGYAEYLLYRGAGEPEPIGFKNGFCVLDISCGGNKSTPKYSCDYMGITAGCYDVYDSSVDCQWIDVTDIPDGDYTMVARINWNKLPDIRGMYESTYENNWAQSCINLDRSSGELVLSIVENCPDYSDCLGILFGSAVEDCNGWCGGTAHYGDINGDGRLDSLDVLDYLELLSSVSDATPCNDVSGNGILSIYDVVLVEDCLFDYYENDPNHNHCLFPINIINEDQDAHLSISGINVANRTIDISYYSNADIKAFHFEIMGISNITEVINLSDQNFAIHTNNKKEIFALLKLDHLVKTATDKLQPFIRITYDEIENNIICVYTVDLINADNHRIKISANEPSCELSTPITEIEDSEEIVISPNPTSDLIYIKMNQKGLNRIDMININGIMVKRITPRIDEVIKISIHDLNPGLYFINIEIGKKLKVYPVVIKL